MYLGIGDKQLKQIDNTANREIVINNLITDYRSVLTYTPRETDLGLLKTKLSEETLYNLLLMTGEDCDALVYSAYLTCLMEKVEDIVYGAERFFEIGGQATLQGDEYYNEFNYLFGENGIIPIDTKELSDLFYSPNEWVALINKVATYVCGVVARRCKWVAFSNDGSYIEQSGKVYDAKEGKLVEGFSSKKECYDNMRDAVLSKMKWNTEYDEDFNYEDDAVEYKVRFTRDMIIHSSYSGIYVYKIVDMNENPTKEDIFTEEFNDWLNKMQLYC